LFIVPSVYKMHTSVSILISLAITTVTVVRSQSSCSESPTAVCSHPKPITPDFKWIQEAQPADGWHMELANAAVRLHLAELIQGKLLTYSDDYSNMCGRVRLEHSETSVDGKMYGFDGGKFSYQCYPSKAENGATNCDYSSVGLSKYADSSINYVTYTDNKNLLVGILCFPNGENGWFSMSRTKSLTEEEKNSILEHVKSIGYDDSDVVPMYNDKCSDNSVDASSFFTERVRPNGRRLRNRQRSRY